MFLLLLTVAVIFLLSLSVVVLVTQRSAPIPYVRTLVHFLSRFLPYLRHGLKDFYNLGVYTHISRHPGSNGTLIFELC